jgi:quercetin dioxygenase-like cupin family protein
MNKTPMNKTPGDRSQVVVGIADQLPIPNHATTSRAVIDNTVTRVVMFAFDAGEQLTEHTAAPPVVVQLIRGRLRFEVADGSHELDPGDVVYLAPGEPHALEAIEPSLLSLVLIKNPT